MDNSYKERLKKHIEALETAYDNVIVVLNEDIKKDDKGDIKIKDTQKKIFAEGIDKLSNTADDLMKKIKESRNELDKLNKPKPKKEGEGEKTPEIEEPKEEGSSNSNLNDHLKD